MKSSSSASRRWLCGLIAALAVLPVAHGATAAESPRSSAVHGCRSANIQVRHTTLQAVRAAVICLVNRERAARGLPPFRQSRALDRVAELWTRTMVRDGVFSHGTSFARRITGAGVSWSAAGENIATGFSTPHAVVGAWMASTGHCRNILDPSFRLLGVGVDPHPVRGWANGGATWTQDFALPAGRRAPSQNWGPADGCPYAG
jgi:uncharacterized protein YkwD